jgi:hypothetical protein
MIPASYEDNISIVVVARNVGHKDLWSRIGNLQCPVKSLVHKVTLRRGMQY